MAGKLTLQAPTASQDITVSFDQGLVANTDYLLKLIAEDVHGNCQVTTRVLLEHRTSTVAQLLHNVTCTGRATVSHTT